MRHAWDKRLATALAVGSGSPASRGAVSDWTDLVDWATTRTSSSETTKGCGLTGQPARGFHMNANSCEAVAEPSLLLAGREPESLRFQGEGPWTDSTCTRRAAFQPFDDER